MKKRGNEKPRNAPPEKYSNGTMVKETNHMVRKFRFIGVNDLIDGDGSSFNNTEVRIRFGDEIEVKSLDSHLGVYVVGFMVSMVKNPLLVVEE